MAEVIGRREWGLLQNRDGHRTYGLKLLVKGEYEDGPWEIANATYMPLTGGPWVYGNDFDYWAYCSPEMRCSMLVKNRPNKYWEVDRIFTTIPFKRCGDFGITDPLSEPMQIGGSFIKYVEEATEDRNGNKIKNSSHEMFRGPNVEFDANRPTVVIRQNVPDLQLDLFSEMVDTVNDDELWGLSSRKVKLSNVPWERKVYNSCDYYYTRTLEFDINFKGFDRKIIDEGTKVLRGRWVPDVLVSPVTFEWTPDATADEDNPKHFIRYKDQNQENCRVLLDGAGNPLADGLAPHEIDVEKYLESNFYDLNIPSGL